MKLVFSLLALGFSLSLYGMDLNTQFLEAIRRRDYPQAENVLRTAPRGMINVSSQLDEAGNTPLHYAPSVQMAESLIRNGANLNIQNENGWTPLHLAIIRNDNKLAELLMKSGANLNIQDKTDDTPLHIAARNGNVSIVRSLLAQGADVLKINKADRLAADVADLAGHQELAKILDTYKTSQRFATPEIEDITLFNR